jgi:DNA (cytosine-5)-methyltransferase 1
MFTLIDLFAGTGGLSEGFSTARNGGKRLFDVRLLVDNDPEAAFNYRYNRPQANYLIADISVIEPETILSKAGLGKGELGVLVGGPPCQGFSVLRHKHVLEDPRNGLMRRFLKIAIETRPRLFIIENVPSLLTAANGKFWDEIQSYMVDDYFVKAEVLNAYDYGVPQWRKRTFIAGLRKDLEISDFSLPSVQATKKVHAKALIPDGEEKDFLPIIKPWIATEEAIGDLPPLQPGEEASFYTREPFTDYQAARRRGSNVLSNHVARRHDEKFLEKLAKIEEGGSNQELDGRSRFDRGREIKYLSQAYGRLHRKGIAQTITAHFLNPGSGRFIHYQDLRSITVREAARFQSFDDNFVFYGPVQTQQRLVGNAVPPLMARALAEYFAKTLSGD